MNININHSQNTETIAVWFGKQGKDGFFYRNGKIDLAQSKKRYNYFWELKHGVKGGK